MGGWGVGAVITPQRQVGNSQTRVAQSNRTELPPGGPVISARRHMASHGFTECPVAVPWLSRGTGGEAPAVGIYIP